MISFQRLWTALLHKHNGTTDEKS